MARRVSRKAKKSVVKGPKRRVPFRRKREGKTDYRLRMKLILSNKPRLVVRRSLKNTNVQLIEASEKGDVTIASANSKELEKFGWKASTGNVPASYLTGLLCGIRALRKGKKEAVLDIGLQTPIRGSRIFSALKGAIDAGLNIPHSDEVFPDESRLRGIHISEYAEVLAKEDPKKLERQFSKYLAASINPTDVPKMFDEVKHNILSMEE
ncbi:MAG: 50S ribosomal protein L18 [Candidatus Hydrothermarchaeota archaeon]